MLGMLTLTTSAPVERSSCIARLVGAMACFDSSEGKHSMGTPIRNFPDFGLDNFLLYGNGIAVGSFASCTFNVSTDSMSEGVSSYQRAGPTEDTLYVLYLVRQDPDCV